MNTLKFEFETKHFCFADCSPEDFVTTTLPCRFGPKILWLFKLFGAIYWIISIALFIFYQGAAGWFYLSNWGVFIILIYFVCSFLVVTHGLFFAKPLYANSEGKNGESCGLINHSKSTAQGHLRWYHKMTWVLQTLALDSAIAITVVYWIMTKLPFTLLLFNKHAMNTIFMVIDFWLVCVPVRLLHVVYVMAFAFFYSIFSLILFLVGYIPQIYPFLNWSWHPAVAAVVCVLLSTVGCTVVHTFVFLMYKLRTCLASK